jgi:hypothetical protein
MLSFEGEVKLIDFGLARSGKAPAASDDGKGQKKVLGKLAYMSPEQARGDDVDERGDLFSVAVLATELVTGRRFYEGMDHQAIWSVAGRGGHRPEAWSFLHKGLQRVLDKALQPGPPDRYETAEAFKEALDGYIFARGHRSSPRELRELLDRDFHDTKDAHRALLVEVQQAQASARDEPEPPVAEATRVIASAAITLSDEAQPRAAPPDAPTAPLPTLTRARAVADPAEEDRDRTLIYLAVGAGGLFLLLLLGLMVLLASGEEPEAGPEPEPVAASPAPLSEPEREPMAVEHGDAGAPGGGEDKARKRRRKQRANKKREKARPRAPGLAASERDQRRYLKANCADVACAARVLDQRLPTGATLEDKRAAAKALANCVYRCSKLPAP